MRAEGSQELAPFLLAFRKIICRLSELKCNLFSLCENHGKISGFKWKKIKDSGQSGKEVFGFHKHMHYNAILTPGTLFFFFFFLSFLGHFTSSALF
jgi:hypothetical protein